MSMGAWFFSWWERENCLSAWYLISDCLDKWFNHKGLLSSILLSCVKYLWRSYLRSDWPQEVERIVECEVMSERADQMLRVGGYVQWTRCCRPQTSSMHRPSLPLSLPLSSYFFTMTGAEKESSEKTEAKPKSCFTWRAGRFSQSP